jgi:hypothetical protein
MESTIDIVNVVASTKLAEALTCPRSKPSWAQFSSLGSI